MAKTKVKGKYDITKEELADLFDTENTDIVAYKESYDKNQRRLKLKESFLAFVKANPTKLEKERRSRENQEMELMERNLTGKQYTGFCLTAVPSCNLLYTCRYRSISEIPYVHITQKDREFPTLQIMALTVIMKYFRRRLPFESKALLLRIIIKNLPIKIWREYKVIMLKEIDHFGNILDIKHKHQNSACW